MKFANVFAHYGAREIESSRFVNKIKSELKERYFIESTFERYVSPTVVKEIIDNPDMLHLGGEKKTLTLLFTDIGNFTNLSEALSPEEVVKRLNEYFQGMCSVILELQGTISRFMGDAIYAFWGAPIAQEDHALLACRTAIKCREFLKHLEEKWVSDGLPPRTYRFGLNTGEVIIGNVGSTSRIEYMAVGDDVNLASRLEGVNKFYGTQIIISEKTFSLVKDVPAARELDLIQVVGKSRAIRVYELLGEKEEIDDKTARLLDYFEAGINAYRGRKWEESISHFTQVLQASPEDGPAKTYIQRCLEYQLMPPAHDWNGVYELKGK